MQLKIELETETETEMVRAQVGREQKSWTRDDVDAAARRSLIGTAAC